MGQSMIFGSIVGLCVGCWLAFARNRLWTAGAVVALSIVTLIAGAKMPAPGAEEAVVMAQEPPASAPMDSDDKTGGERSIFDGPCETKEGCLAAASKDDLRMAIQCARTDDREALASMVAEGRAMMLKEGSVVYATDLALLDSFVRVRPKGLAVELWVHRLTIQPKG